MYWGTRHCEWDDDGHCDVVADVSEMVRTRGGEWFCPAHADRLDLDPEDLDGV